MKKIIYISVLIFAQTVLGPIGFVYSQNILWQKIYPSPIPYKNLATWDICKADSNNFYLMNSIAYISFNYITKINPYGEIIWNKFLDTSVPVSVVSSDNGSGVEISQLANYIKIFKINPVGSILWSRAYNDFGVPNKIIRTSFNSYLVCGYDYPPNAVITELDSLGNIIWRKQYPGPYTKEYWSICEANNGGYLAVGILVVSTWDYGYGVIDRIDSRGNLIWEKTYWQSGSGTQFRSIDKCSGGYVLSGQGHDSLSHNWGIYIIKIDTLGNKIFSRYISDKDTNIIYTINDIATIDNKFIGVGCKFNQVSDTSFPILLSLNSDGSTNNLKIMQNSLGVFDKAIVINNNNFIAVGEYDDSLLSMGYAVRSDTNFEILPIGIKKIAKNLPGSYQLFQNYPNPFNPTTKIKFQAPPILPEGETTIKLVIYDVLGKEVVTLINERLKVGTYEVTFDGTNLSSGIYFYSLIINGNIISSRKMLMVK